jgi:DNA-binding CsgD family transcriptional regulator
MPFLLPEFLLDEQRQTAPPRLEALIENVPGNVYRRVRRPDGSYYFAFLSSGLFRHFGIDNTRLLSEGTLRFDWIHPEDRARFAADLDISAAMLSLLDHRVRVVGQNGEVHWARGIARPERLPDGTVIWDGIVIDVTREVEAEAALRITKDETERAHRQTTAVIKAVTQRLEPPIAELESLLETLGDQGPVGPAIRESLRVCLEALRMVSDREPVPEEQSARGITQKRRVQALGAAALTGRQREVLGLLSEGLSNKAIAQKLHIAPGTVRLHVAAILRAMKARSRRELFTGASTASG